MNRAALSRMLAVFMLGLGTAMIIQTIRAGGGFGLHTGYILGGGLILAGLLRLYIARVTGQSRSDDHNQDAS